jgi:uncharacterized protein (TIGR02266 family)
MTERRDRPRVPLAQRVRVKYRDLDDFLAAHTTDISSGGMFIAWPDPRPVGTLLHVQFSMGDNEPLIEGKARVAWIRTQAEETPGRPAGMGLAFISLDEKETRLIDRVIQAYLQTTEQMTRK